MTRTLVLGGTGWLGHEIARQLVERGNDVTCLARGESGSIPAGAALVKSDRTQPGAYDLVRGQSWDEVIELSYEPQLIAGALEALNDAATHWTLVSSVSVYSSNAELGADENASLVEPEDLDDYVHAKVAAEAATAGVLENRLLIARPGLIAGPGDPSDRLGYWPARLALARNEPVLVPTLADRFVQFIDVRDLAAWLIRGGSAGITGTYNVVGKGHDFAAFLAMAGEVAGHEGRFVAADDDWLVSHNVNYWAGPHSLPLWLPRDDIPFAQRSNAGFLATGGEERELRETLKNVLADEDARGLSRARRSGLTRTEETDLLAQLLT